MNPKLQKLFEQSFTDHQGEGFDPKRFAELIVKECISIAEAGNANAVATVIKDHFGIGEHYVKRS